MSNQSSAAAVGAQAQAVQVYVWELPVRVTHWLIVLSVTILVITGLYISHPFVAVAGSATNHFVTGWVRVIHWYTAIVFDLALLARIAWMFVGNEYARWDQFVPVCRERLRNLLETLKFYLFLRRWPPEVVGVDALTGVTYVLLFLLEALIATTGLALYGVSAAYDSVMRPFALLVPYFGGLETVRWIHHVCMWLILAFIPYHVCTRIMVSTVERNHLIDSMFTGRKLVRRELVQAADGR
jgi:Ni/Fe-hydrogenase 1 B-type cytochrome subunit